MPSNLHLRLFTDSEEQEIAEAYLEGWDGPQLAALYEIKLNAIYRILKRRKIARRGRGSVNVPKGEISRQGNGYLGVWIPPTHPMASMRYSDGGVLVHRLVMAEALGRPLTRHETVHHINGNKDDYDLSNLQLRIGNHGRGQAYRCCDCGSNRIMPVEL